MKNKNPYWDMLDDDELSMIESMSLDTEESIVTQIKLLSVRERRLMTLIKSVKTADSGLVLDSVVEKTTAKDGDEKVDITNKNISAADLVLRCESELTRIAARKTRCIEILDRMRTSGDASDEGDITSDWIEAVINN